MEVIRPRIDRFSKPMLTAYLRLEFEEAQNLPDQLEIAGETYRLSHFFSFKCNICGVCGHKGKRHDAVTKKKKDWTERMARAYDAVDIDNKRRWIDTLPEELREIKLTSL